MSCTQRRTFVSTLLFIKGKSKDGLKSRKDLKEMRIRKDLHPKKREIFLSTSSKRKTFLSTSSSSHFIKDREENILLEAC